MSLHFCKLKTDENPGIYTRPDKRRRERGQQNEIKSFYWTLWLQFTWKCKHWAEHSKHQALINNIRIETFSRDRHERQSGAESVSWRERLAITSRACSRALELVAITKSFVISLFVQSLDGKHLPLSRVWNFYRFIVVSRVDFVSTVFSSVPELVTCDLAWKKIRWLLKSC